MSKANTVHKHRLISKNQYGFRVGVLTEDAVLDLTQNLAKNLDPNIKSLVIFFAKAFDTVFVRFLTRKLENLGIRGIALNIFEAYNVSNM